MKTFKLVGLELVEHDKSQVINLEHGLIIHRQDGENRWLIEAFVKSHYEALFQEAQEKEAVLVLKATITNPSNDPATIRAKVQTILKMEDRLSILLDGLLVRSKSGKLDMAETVLHELVDKGLGGNDLVKAFKTEIRIKRGSEMTVK